MTKELLFDFLKTNNQLGIMYEYHKKMMKKEGKNILSPQQFSQRFGVLQHFNKVDTSFTTYVVKDFMKDLGIAGVVAGKKGELIKFLEA